MAQPLQPQRKRNRGDCGPLDSMRSHPRSGDRMVRPNVRVAVVGILACVVLAACGTASVDGPGTTTRSVQSATLAAGQPIPTPTGDVALELSGAIGSTNDGEKLLLDLETLERMPLVEAIIFEPFLKTELRFQGVLVSDLFRYAGVDAAGRVAMTALDDSYVEFDVTKLDADRVLLAVRADGNRISIADGGPARIVFLDADDGLGANTDNWIWSVSHLAFEEAR